MSFDLRSLKCVMIIKNPHKVNISLHWFSLLGKYFIFAIENEDNMLRLYFRQVNLKWVKKKIFREKDWDYFLLLGGCGVAKFYLKVKKIPKIWRDKNFLNRSQVERRLMILVKKIFKLFNYLIKIYVRNHENLNSNCFQCFF